MLRSMAVCAILAVALAAPEIAGEDDEDDDEGSSSSSEDQGATTVDLSGEQHRAEEEDRQMLTVEGGEEPPTGTFSAWYVHCPANIGRRGGCEGGTRGCEGRRLRG